MPDNVIGEAFISIRASLDEFKKDTARLNKEVESTVKNIQQKMQQVGNSMTNVGKSMSLKVTAPIVALGAASVVAFKEVDNAMDTILTKTGAVGESADDMMNTFKEVAGNMPTDMQTVGEAIGELNTQFKMTGEELKGATYQLLEFAQINGTDVTTSAQNAKQAMEAYGMTVEDFDFILDAVTKAAQDTGLGVDQIFDAVVRGAPQIKALGLNFAEAAQLMGKFEQKGLDSSKALSYLSRAQVEWAKEGKTLQQGLADLQKALASSKDETEQLSIASELFGTRGATFMLDAIQRGALDFESLANAAENAGGAVVSTYESTLDPIDKATIAMNNLKLAGADLAGSIQEVLAPILNKVVDYLQAFVEWFDNLDPTIKQTIVVVGLVVAAIGPLLLIIGQGIKMVSSLGAVFGMLTNPIGLAIAAIVAVIAIGVALYKNWDTIAAYLKEIWEGIAGTVTAIWGSITSFISDSWNAVKDVTVGVWESISGFLANIWGGILNTATSVWNGILGVITTVVNGIIKVVNVMIGGLNKISFTIPKWVPLIGGNSFGFDLKPIPLLAAGGEIKQPGLAVVGEAGAELLSMPRGATVTPLSNAVTPVNITITGNYFRNEDDIDAMAEAIVKRLKRAGIYV